MESKFKERLYRLALLFTAALALAMAMAPQDSASRVALISCALGLGIAALGYQRLPKLPDIVAPVLLALLLTLMLWLDPERHALWLWGWAAVLILPQPPLLLLIHALLALSCWWQVYRFIDTEQGLLAGVLLAALMLLGLARSLAAQMRWQEITSRSRLVADMRLWPGPQLGHDLPLETTRCQREGTHGELLLLRGTSIHQPALAGAVLSATHSYEGCYRINGQTLAVLMINRDVNEARQRRDSLLASLPPPFQARFITLDPALSLDAQLLALSRQEHPVIVLEEAA